MVFSSSRWIVGEEEVKSVERFCWWTDSLDRLRVVMVERHDCAGVRGWIYWKSVVCMCVCGEQMMSEERLSILQSSRSNGQVAAPRTPKNERGNRSDLGSVDDNTLQHSNDGGNLVGRGFRRRRHFSRLLWLLSTTKTDRARRVVAYFIICLSEKCR